MRFKGDDRGVSIGIARLFLSLAVGSFLLYIVSATTDPLFEKSKAAATDQVAVNGRTYLGQAIDFMPIVMLMVAFFGMIAYTVFSREAVR